MTALTHEADPTTGTLVPLFNPRAQVWSEHFVWANGGTHIVSLTPTGRATVIALRVRFKVLHQVPRLSC